MIKSSVEKAMNEQLNAELYSAYLYLSMSAYYESNFLPGFAHWMRVQAKEELNHVMKFYKYLHERGGKVTLSAIKNPPTEWKSPLDVFENAYSHEQKITGLINNLVQLSSKEGDIASENFLMWFIDEQVEEEASAQKIVQMLKLIKDSPNGLYMLDSELAKREG